MDYQQAADLLRERLGRSVAPRLVEQLLRRTDSDPTLLDAVADQVDPDADGLHRLPLSWPPEQVEQVLTELALLSPKAREVIAAAAVIGREFDLAILELTCGESDILGALEEIGAAGLIRPLSAQVFSFVRALQREVCYDALGPRQRATWHERAGSALVRMGALGGTRAATVRELAHHTAEAAALGGPDRLDAAVAASATAGAAAAEDAAYDLAAGYFAQAALLAGRAGWAPGPAGRLLAAAGTARVRAATSAQVRDAGRASLTGAMRLGQRAGDAGLLAVAALGLGPRPTLGALAGAEVSRPVDQVRRSVLAEASALAPPDDPSSAARLAARLAVETLDSALAGQALTRARASGDPRAVAEALLAVTDTAEGGGGGGGARGEGLDGGALDQVAREAGALGDAELLARAYDLAAAAAIRAGATAEALSRLSALAALGNGRQTAFVHWYALRAAAELAVLRGEPGAPDAVAAAFTAGQAVDPAAAQACDQVLRAVLARPGSPAGLTAREQEVLAWALRGTPAKEIAEGLVLGERTVETHLASIYRKLGVRTRIELIKKHGGGSSLL